MSQRAEQVIMINDTSSVDGGSAKLALSLTKAVAESGLEVRLFAGDDGKNSEYTSATAGVDGVGGVRLVEQRFGSVFSGVYNHAAARKLADYIAQHDTPNTVYHLHSWAQILSPAVFQALKPVATRTVATLHDFFITCPNGNFFVYPKEQICSHTPLSAACVTTDCDKRNYAHKLWRVVRQRTLRGILDFHDTNITFVIIGDGMKRFLQRSGVPSAKLKTIVNPADRFFQQRIEAEKNKKALFIGRLQKEKGVDLLAAAARAAGAPLQIVGDGPLRDELKQIYPEAIFSGWRDAAGVGEALSQARFLVMPSRCVEPYGLVAAEALCAGVPVLFSNSCMIGDRIEADASGKRVDIYDQARFAGALRESMDNDEVIRTMSVNAWANADHVAQTYDAWQKAYIDVYDEMIAAAAAKN